jgi:hypothetical protein
VGLARRVYHSLEEVLLNDNTAVYISEGGDLLVVLVLVNLDHFPAEEDLDSALLALLESDLVGIGELEDLLVWGPILYASVFGCTTLELILAEEMFIVEGVEVSALALVGELWRIANHVTIGVVPAVVVVAINALLVVNGVHEDVALRLVLELSEAFDVLG